MMKCKTRGLTVLGMFCALAYAAAAVGRIPLVLFLKYDPKDIVIAVCGLLFGPLPAFKVTLAVSFAEMLTVSENGVLGFMMNVISSCAFACTAAFAYRRKQGRQGALPGLLWGWACMVPVMLLWNYFIAPIYMGCTREAAAALLLPVFLPFNLVKGGLNAALTALLYQPAAAALRRSRLLEAEPKAREPHAGHGGAVLPVLILAVCILSAFLLKGIF